MEFSRAPFDAVEPGTWIGFPIRVVHGYPLALGICKKGRYTAMFMRPFGNWFRNWEAFSAGKVWTDENGEKGHVHPFSFNLNKIKFNTLSFQSMNVSLKQSFCSFSAAKEGDTITFKATMTVTRDACGL